MLRDWGWVIFVGEITTKIIFDYNKNININKQCWIEAQKSHSL